MATLGELTAWAHLRGAGRQGSAIADQLIDFGRHDKWIETLVDLAHAGKARNEADWRRFREAVPATPT